MNLDGTTTGSYKCIFSSSYTLKKVTKSSTVCPNGPVADFKSEKVEALFLHPVAPPLVVTLKLDGLYPLIPLNAAGTLILPPISPPTERGTHWAATKEASPPELPPLLRPRFQGFLEQPQT